MSSPSPGALAEYPVTLDLASLREATVLDINIPDYHRAAIRDDFEARPGGGYRWHGRIDAVRDVLVTTDGRYAHITIDGIDEGRWTVRPFGDSHLLTVVDLSFPIPPDEVGDPGAVPVPAFGMVAGDVGLVVVGSRSSRATKRSVTRPTLQFHTPH